MHSLWEMVQRLIKVQDAESHRKLARVLHGRYYRDFLRKGLLPFEAEDATANLIWTLVQKIEKYEPVANASFESWLNTLARHIAADHHRRRLKTESIDDHRQVVAHLPALRGAKEEETGSEIELDVPKLIALHEAMERLSADDRTMLELRDLHGEAGFTEIAQLLGIKTGTARQRHRRACNRLRKLLEHDGRVCRQPKAKGA